MLPAVRNPSSCMEKLDRLEWSAGMALTSYGVRVGIRTNEPAVLDRVRELLPPGWTSSDDPVVPRLLSLHVARPDAPRWLKPLHVLYSNDLWRLRSPDLDEVLRHLESEVQLYVAERAESRIFLHAGVVGFDGRAVLVPGSSFSGKTTLVAELLRAGGVYYSDEYAVLDRDGRVHPYPRTLSIRKGSDPLGRKTDPAELGAETGQTPLDPGIVVLTEYRPGVRWRPRRISSGRAVLAMLEHTVPARRRPAQALSVLRRIAEAVEVLQGTRGEAEEAVPRILDALEGSRNRSPHGSPPPDPSACGCGVVVDRAVATTTEGVTS